MRVNLVLLGLAVTLSSISLANGQVSIDVSKITCDQFAQGKVGLPRTTAVCRQNILDIWFGDKRVCGSSGLEVQAAIAC